MNRTSGRARRAGGEGHLPVLDGDVPAHRAVGRAVDRLLDGERHPGERGGQRVVAGQRRAGRVQPLGAQVPHAGQGIAPRGVPCSRGDHSGARLPAPRPRARPTNVTTPSAAEPWWNESWYFDFATTDGSLGGYVRIGPVPQPPGRLVLGVPGGGGPAAGDRGRPHRRAAPAPTRSRCAPRDCGPTTRSRSPSTT